MAYQTATLRGDHVLSGYHDGQGIDVYPAQYTFDHLKWSCCAPALLQAHGRLEHYDIN
jgi:hypothetical protein